MDAERLISKNVYKNQVKALLLLLRILNLGKDISNYRFKTQGLDLNLVSKIGNCFFSFRSLVAAGLIPYYDESPDSGDDSISDDVGPFMNMDVIFKNSDKNVDLKVETSQGVREYQDYPLKLEWTKRLRNMKLDRMIGRLIQSKIICKSK